MRKLTVFLLLTVTTSQCALAEQLPELLLGPGEPGGLSRKLIAEGLPQEEPGSFMTSGRSPAKEGGLSFLLPGLGQYRMGKKTRGYIYFALEAAGWITLGGSLWRSSAKQGAYEDYAVAFAGVSGTGYDEVYYENVGRWVSSDGPGGYNEYVRREARDLYYPDIEAMEAYYLDNYIPAEIGWRWETLDAQHNFNTLRSASDDAERNAIYAAFYLFALRIVSAVDAVYLARRAEVGYDTSSDIPVRFEAGPMPGGFYLAVNRPF